MAASTEELSGMAQQLQGLVAQFKVEGGDKDVKVLPDLKVKKAKEKKAKEEAEELTDITLKREDAA